MKHTLSFMIITALVGLCAVSGAQAQTKLTAKSSSYETLSDADRRVVSAIYESQLGSRHDLAGHPLLSKDKIAAMRRGGGWDEVYGRLTQNGSVAYPSLREAMASYSQDTRAPLSRALIISTAAGEQIVVPRRMPRAAPPPPLPNPALANVIPTKPVRRAQVSVQELPVLTASGEAVDSSAAVDPVSDGLIAPGVAASATQSR